MFILLVEIMKKIKWFIIGLWIVLLLSLTIPSFAVTLKGNSKYFSPWDSATSLVEKIHDEVPEENTDLDKVNSVSSCVDLSLWASSNYTITKTLCYLKAHMWDYIQYVIYFWLTAATIFLIRNWFKIVVSQDRDKQISAFKKNFMYLVVWVVLLVCFYVVIDIFVSVVNLVFE